MIRKLIQNNIGGKKVLTFFLLSTAVYVIMLAITIPRVMSFSGGMKILDMMPTGYNAAYVNELFIKLGESGRQAYLYGQLPFDLIYPALYAIGFCLVLAWLFNRIGKLDGNLIYFCLIPVIAGVFDYCENFGIITMLKSWPEIPANLITVTNLFSILKSGFTSVYFIVLMVVIITFGAKLITKKNR